jgi:hypothetical protein
MTANLSDIAGTIQKEAQEKYSSKNLMEDLGSYNTEVFNEIVEFFKAQNEERPHLEAFEIYLMIEENLPSDNPSIDEIRKTIDSLLGIDMPA